MEITDKTDVHNKTKVRKRFQKCFATLWSNIEKDKGQTVLSTQDKRLIKQQTKGEYLTVAAINKNLFPCKYNENKTTKTLETAPNAYVALFSILLLIWFRIYLYRAPKFLRRGSQHLPCPFRKNSRRQDGRFYRHRHCACRLVCGALRQG